MGTVNDISYAIVFNVVNIKTQGQKNDRVGKK